MIYIIDDPVHDPRWSSLIDRHPSASVFHTPGWLEALRRTYGYEPVAVTTSAGATIQNGLVACRVRSWPMRRLVSLPFSDHCDPLASGTDLEKIVEGLAALARERRWGAMELRPRCAAPFVELAERGGRLRAGNRYCLHAVDLRPELSQIFASLHRTSAQRTIRRAEREGVTCEVGASDEQLQAFFGLLRLARRRHGLPPQPIEWFRNLRDTMAERLSIFLARHDGRPIAALLMLSFRQSVVYKYGGSDATHHALGAVPFLFWHAICAGRAAGATTLDLGRSDPGQSGLIAFKERLGARRSELTYFGSPCRLSVAGGAWMKSHVARIVSVLPDTALDLAGRLLYRRLG